MKRKFVNPALSISMFNCENVVTTASAGEANKAVNVGVKAMEKKWEGKNMAVKEVLIF